jgi:hypothetical protein
MPAALAEPRDGIVTPCCRRAYRMVSNAEAAVSRPTGSFDVAKPATAVDVLLARSLPARFSTQTGGVDSCSRSRLATATERAAVPNSFAHGPLKRRQRSRLRGAFLAPGRDDLGPQSLNAGA